MGVGHTAGTSTAKLWESCCRGCGPWHMAPTMCSTRSTTSASRTSSTAPSRPLSCRCPPALLLNLIAFGLAVAAEQHRSKPTVTPDLAKEYDYCVYDSDVATGYGVGALLLLIAAQVIVMLASQCFCCGCRLKPGLFLLFSW
ncbi:hypothetical protein ZWY2020_045929 [Hordeum vulgare]|nr:hypothetical protein ZWY2020_045929 [Hordeum vulgare]